MTKENVRCDDPVRRAYSVRLIRISSERKAHFPTIYERCRPRPRAPTSPHVRSGAIAYVQHTTSALSLCVLYNQNMYKWNAPCERFTNATLTLSVSILQCCCVECIEWIHAVQSAVFLYIHLYRTEAASLSIVPMHGLLCRTPRYSLLGCVTCRQSVINSCGRSV